MTNSVTVSAASNIALVKYWGKRDTAANDPATASLSIGLEDLRTSTTIGFSDSGDDQVISPMDAASTARLIRFLDRVREIWNIDRNFCIETSNNFPTGSGLASSASGFAALALGINRLLGLELSGMELSRLARRGSGSAARSVFGGFVEVIPSDDAWANRILPADEWPLSVIVAITSEASKQTGSTEAMQISADTSPFYKQWLATHQHDMTTAKAAIEARDFAALAAVSEHNCLKMHATIMTGQPSVLYWLPATVAVMHQVLALREAGIPAFFTIDAGSQVKVICQAGDADRVNQSISAVDGVIRTLVTRVGGEPVISVA